ncbi:hypothetical protein JZU69_03370, partial [bacterium]|nr:hypothetical protein [bacterium]
LVPSSLLQVWLSCSLPRLVQNISCNELHLSLSSLVWCFSCWADSISKNSSFLLLTLSSWYHYRQSSGIRWPFPCSSLPRLSPKRSSTFWEFPSTERAISCTLQKPPLRWWRPVQASVLW